MGFLSTRGTRAGRLDENGALLYSQKGGEFEDMRHLESSALTKFLLQWKPARPD